MYEWENEQDRYEFEYKGYPCLVIRHQHFMQLNGYVGITSEHPLFNKGYWDLDINCHGGLTFAQFGHNKKHKYNKVYMPKYTYKPRKMSLYWLGFDTLHYDDLAPAYVVDPLLNKHFGNGIMTEGTYRNYKYVKDELINIVEQLEGVKNEED